MSRNSINCSRTNPHSGIDLRPPTPLVAYSFDTVVMSHSGFERPNTMLYLHILKGFLEHPCVYELKSMQEGSSHGDAKFKHQPSGEEAMVEFKDGHCKVDDLKSPTRVTHSAYTILDSSRTSLYLFFCWKSHFDCLLTTIGPRMSNEVKGQALFIPRDVLPEAWFNIVPKDSQNLVWEEPEPGYFQQFMVDLRDSSALVSGMTRIMSKFFNENGTHAAQRQIPIAPIPKNVFAEDIDEEMLAADVESSIDDEDGGNETSRFRGAYHLIPLSLQELHYFQTLMVQCCKQ